MVAALREFHRTHYEFMAERINIQSRRPENRRKDALTWPNRRCR
jgi:hypothetical protein